MHIIVAEYQWVIAFIWSKIVRDFFWILNTLPFRASLHFVMWTQGVASLALGYVLHWAFSPSLLNPELECNTTMSVKVGAWHNAHTLHPVLTQKRHSRCTCPTKLGESAVWMPFFWYFLPWCNKNTRNCNICDSTFGHSLRTFASWKWGK